MSAEIIDFSSIFPNDVNDVYEENIDTLFEEFLESWEKAGYVMALRPANKNRA